MNRCLLILFVVLMLVGGVQGTALDFQNTPDFSEQVIVLQGITGGLGGVTWTQNTSGGNSYIDTRSFGSCTEGYGGAIANADGIVTSYSAATILGGSHAAVTIALYDAAKTRMGGNVVYFNGTALPFPARIEFFSNGTGGTVYVDGVLVGGISGAGITQHPHYVGWQSGYVGIEWGMCMGASSYDDMVWGTTESRFIFGMPETGYFLMKDILNPAANGFYRVNQTVANGTPTLISSTSFTSTYGKNNGNSQLVELSSPSGGAGLTYNTGTKYSNVIYWNLTQFFSQSTTGYGLYQTTINDQSGSHGFATSDWIPYIGSGANIQFDKNSYAVGETAIATVVVSDSYYDLATYSYHVVIQDIYGTEVYDTPISFSTSPHTGTASYTWLSTDGEGVYYGIIYAKRLSDSEELLMNYDVCDLSSNVVFEGFVKDATTTTGLSGATVNLSQGVNVNTVTSGTDGNYTTSGTYVFVADAPTTISASLAGYVTHSYTFTPLIGGVFDVNISLIPIFPTYTGVALGGIVTKPPFGQTVDNALVTVTNGTTVYTATTNSAGYYQIDSMLASKTYGIFGSKTGFSNSTVYSLLVTGT